MNSASNLSPAHAPFPLAVCGQGAVSPLGIGVAALRSQADAPTQSIPLLSDPARVLPAYQVDLTADSWTRWKEEPRLRRASALSLFLAEAATQALATCPAVRTPGARLGLVVAFGTGSILHSRRFFEGFGKQGRKFASPILFPETVYNSPASHLAAILGVRGPCYSLVGDDAGWVTALKVARLWLKIKTADFVLVAGAEELDAAAVEAFYHAGWYRQKKFRPSEGAAAVLLANVNNLSTDSATQITDAHTGWAFRTKKQARNAACELAQALPATIPVYQNPSWNWMQSIEQEALKSISTHSETLGYAGEAFAASAGWKMLRAANAFNTASSPPALSVPIWGLNHQHAWLGLNKHTI